MAIDFLFSELYSALIYISGHNNQIFLNFPIFI